MPISAVAPKPGPHEDESAPVTRSESSQSNRRRTTGLFVLLEAIGDVGMFVNSAGKQQFLRFCTVGLSNFLISFVVYCLVYEYVKISLWLQSDTSGFAVATEGILTRLHLQMFDGAFANTCGYIVSLINSFIWNKLWTFDAAQQTRRQLVSFVLYSLVALAMSSGGIFVLVDLMDWPYRIAWFLWNSLITVATYFSYKHWIFQRAS